MPEYYNVTTNLGDAEIANAIVANTKLNITHIAFGDGNGSVPTPTKTRTSLVREVHRQAVTKYERHATNANWIVIETIIPSDIGGFTIREMGIIANGKLISHGSHAPFEKVVDPSGVSEYRLRFTQNVTDGSVVELTLDESLIYATQAWIDENYIKRSEIVDNLTTNEPAKPVSAKQAKVLQDTKLGKTENAASATKLQTARTIGGVSFDGSANINLPGVNASGNQNTSGNAASATKLQTACTIGGVSFDGSANINLPGVNASGNQNTSGNAASATKLQTARTIGGVSFDGSANINLPGVNASGNQNTSGNAASTTKLQTACTIGGVSFDGSANINLPGVNTAGNQNTTGNAATATTAAACSGNAATATKLQTARTINGVSFDGSANITIADNTKLPLSGGTITGSLNVSDTITVTNVGEQAGAFKKLIQADTTTDGGYIAVGNNAADKGYVEIGTIDDADAEIYASQRTSANAVLRRAKLLDGSGNTSFPGTVTAPTFSGALSGNAATATSLQTARTIGGVGFDGSANINLPGVNTTGNQNTSGNAASATNCSRSVIAGNGLSGGGALTSDSTVTLGTPGNITATSTNSVTETSHTHNLDVNSLPFLGTGINKRKSIISGTTYTNTGNRPIFVTCSMSGSSSIAASARLDGRMIFSTNSSNQYSQSFVVGVGVSYSFTGNNLVCEEYS